MFEFLDVDQDQIFSFGCSLKDGHLARLNEASDPIDRGIDVVAFAVG